MPTSTLTSKGQITVPKAIRERFGLLEGDILEFVVDESGRILVRRRRPGGDASGFLREFAPSSPVAVEEMKQAVRERAEKKAR